MKAPHSSDPAAADPADGIYLPARFIPTPRSISREAQAFLSHSSPFDADLAPGSKDDKAAWRAHAEKINEGIIALTERNAERYPAEVVTHSLSASLLYEVRPRNLSPRREQCAILYLHGGGFFVGGGRAAVNSAMKLAGLSQTRVFSLDYRMLPDFPFPAPLEDSVEAYRFLLKGHRPQSIALFGPSAGGNLAPAAILKARDQSLPLPAACAVHSPVSDLTESGDSYSTNDTLDIVLKHRMPSLLERYANGHDLSDPLLSPIFADFSKGFPPTVLTSGTRDLLLSSTVLLHRSLRRAGILAELHVFEAMTHAPFFDAPEEHEVDREHVEFLLRHMKGA
ncbi:MAG TPA: alpha/beta hydrolase fold domain-containing protein [Steroidobacteraceae bacterium]|nr:alpha/beta hydrolase fold domain-containing protein [Steroidobacteraceae bacterium]